MIAHINIDAKLWADTTTTTTTTTTTRPTITVREAVTKLQLQLTIHSACTDFI